MGADFEEDGRIDLTNSATDAIGWKSGRPTHYPVRLDSATLEMDTLMAPDILPTFPVTRFLS